MSKTNYWEKFEGNINYHIYNRGINGTSIFKKEENYHYFLRKWKKLIHPFFETMAYCLMPNHFHFLVKVKPLTPEIKQTIQAMETPKSRKMISEEISYNEFLEDQFKRMFSAYALAFNKQENRTGSLFQKRFKRVGIGNDFKLWHLLAYIHHNPIHHKFEQEYDKWKFSSYATFLSNQQTLIARDKVLLWFDDNKEKAKALFYNYHQDFKIDRNLDYLE
jgi:putative transposase